MKQREAAYAKRNYTASGVRKGQEVVLFDFNPNTADSVQLKKLGLSSFVVRNILRYREKGGVFRTPEAFARIYGLTEEQYLLLKPYIQIPPREENRRDSVYKQVQPQRIEKYPEGTLVALNEADTAQLKRIPGVGSGIAKMIVAYRNRLGGFVRLEQLQEIPHVDTCLNKWFVVQGAPFRKIRVNKDGLDKLRNHPYMDFYKAKAILEYRRKRGNIKVFPGFLSLKSLPRKTFNACLLIYLLSDLFACIACCFSYFYRNLGIVNSVLEFLAPAPMAKTGT